MDKNATLNFWINDDAQSIMALQELEKEKLPVIIIAVSPVSGGVTASWVYGPSVFLFAESESTKIMFAGPA